MQWAARFMWAFGSLIPTLVLAASVAGVKGHWPSSVLLLLCTALTVFGNERLLSIIEATYGHDLHIKSGTTKRPASSAKGLYAFVVTAGELFNADLGWAVMLLIVLAGELVLQTIRAAPPALFLLARGYRLHDVSIGAGGIEVWVRSRRLGAGDVVEGTELEQKFWFGRAKDV
jgi:hypothetical protein